MNTQWHQITAGGENKDKWISRIHRKIGIGKLHFLVSMEVMNTMISGKKFEGGQLFQFGSLLFCTYDELWEPIFVGLKKWKQDPVVTSTIFDTTFKGEEKKFFMSLVDNEMTICYADER